MIPGTIKDNARGCTEKTKKNGVFRLYFSLGKNSETGKYMRTPKITFHCKSKNPKNWPKECEKALAEYRKELEGGTETSTPPTALANYCWNFHAMRKGTMGSPLSYEREELDIRHIQELFGDIDIKDIKPGDVRKAYSASRESGRFSESEIRRIHVKLRQILQTAVDDDIIAKNPCQAVSLPKRNIEARKSLNEDEASRFLHCLYKEEQSPCVVCAVILTFLGLRKGEALGLSWRDLDAERRLISIERQYTNDKTERPPKSKQSRRTISAAEELVAYLESWKSKQAVVLAKYSIAQTENTPIVHSVHITEKDGEKKAQAGRVDGHNFSRWFRDFCVDNGFGSYEIIDKTFVRNGKTHYRGRHYTGLVPHELRHTNATLLLSSGVDYKTVQTRLGHADPSTTLAFYAHALESSDRAAAKAMQDILD